MCNFLSALVLPSGDLVWSPLTDSHEDLIDHAELKDNNKNFVRLEFSPKADYADPSTYVFKVDTPSPPRWFTAAACERAKQQLKDIVTRMIILNDRKVLLGGCWILKSVKIQRVFSARILAMYGSSHVNAMYGSSHVGEMCDSSKVNAMRDSSHVDAMYGSSNVGEMCDSSNVGEMCDSSHVDVMYRSSEVNAMRDSSKVNAMRDSSHVDAMRDSSKVLNKLQKAQAPR